MSHPTWAVPTLSAQAVPPSCACPLVAGLCPCRAGRLGGRGWLVASHVLLQGPSRVWAGQAGPSRSRLVKPRLSEAALEGPSQRRSGPVARPSHAARRLLASGGGQATTGHHAHPRRFHALHTSSSLSGPPRLARSHLLAPEVWQWAIAHPAPRVKH